MAFILIVGALFTGAGIYTMENKRNIDYKPASEVMRCQQEGSETVCRGEK